MRQQAAIVIRGTDMCATELDVAHNALVRYRGTMAGVVRSMGVNGPSVEDVVHDAFEMACRKAKADRPDPRDEARFLGWLCALAKFAALTARNDNARNREVSSPTEELEAVPEPNRAYIGHYDDKIAASVVLANLSIDDRALIREHFFEDKTVQELAVERGVPWTTMRSRLDGVIDRARVIMSDKSFRRRALGALVPAWLLVSMTDVRRRLAASWANVKPVAVAASLGFAAGGALIAFRYEAQHSPSAESLIGSAVVADKSLAVVEPHAVVQVAIEEQAAGFAPCVQPSSASTPDAVSSNPAGAAGGVKRRENVAEVQNVEAPRRAIVPWGIGATVRDIKP